MKEAQKAWYQVIEQWSNVAPRLEHQIHVYVLINIEWAI